MTHHGHRTGDEADVTTSTVSGLLAERMAERLRLYRACVARVARGEGVPADEAVELRRAMGLLGIPSFAFRRDVQAWSTSSTARGYRLAELELFHPQLFVDVEEWVQNRVQTVAQRAGRGWCR